MAKNDDGGRLQVRLMLTAGLVLADVIHRGIAETPARCDEQVDCALRLADRMIERAEGLGGPRGKK